jgi:fimbrial chaperone protein
MPRVLHAPRRRLALLALAVASGGAVASGLQVAPVTLSLSPAQNADGLWLSNTGDSVIHAQVRVYHWSQDGNGDQLTPSQGLVISPPMLQLAVGEPQLVRVIRLGAPPNGPGAVEDAFRVAIDELPVDMSGKKGLQFVLHYSVPVFVEPAGPAAAPPALRWRLQRDGDHAVLEVGNAGGSHAQLARVSFIDSAGRRSEITPGLLGYVLPGATMRWVLKPPVAVFASGGTLEASINGEKATQKLSLAAPAR